MKTYLVNFADDKFKKSQKKLNESALKFGVDKVFSFSPDDIVKTDFYEKNRIILEKKRGFGYWLWKPYIIIDTLSKLNDGDILIYSDSGIEIIKDLQPLINLCLKNKDVIVFCDGGEHLNRVYTKRDCFIGMDCDSEEYWNANQCMASFSIYIKNDKCFDFLNQWLFYCEKENLITDIPNIYKKDNFFEFIDHRHDQSIFSLLVYKMKKEIFRDPTQWGNHLKKEEFRENGEFLQKKYNMETVFTNSNYSTILNHHREKKQQFFRVIFFKIKYILLKIRKLLNLRYFTDVNKVDELCPICFNKNDQYKIIDLKSPYIIACRNCFNGRTVPEPSIKLYEEDDFHSQFNHMEINNLPSQWRMALIRQIKIIKKHFQEGSSILEIGCGQGLLLEELKKYFNVIGVEPSISASKISRLKGVETITGYFQDVVNNELKDKKFNLVIVSHVVEHIKDYSSFIDQILKILSNNGQILFIQTNYLGLMPRYLKSDWYAWVPEQHYWHFTPNGLTYILEKKGLTVKKIEYSSLAHGNIISFSYLIIPQTGDQFHLLAGL